MKKHLTSFVMLAATALASSVLVGCGDDVQELESNFENQGEAVVETTVDESCTLFSTGDDGTRTWMDIDRKFYWSEGDQIYVNTEGNKFTKTFESRLATDSRTADFVLKGVSLTEPRCSVVYIGNGMNSTDTEVSAANLKVKIEKTQTQSAWSDKAHVGLSGDCGVDEAKRDNVTGKYSFTLKHKAAYLVFQPYKALDITRTWTLMKIEIITDGTTSVAGTYPFGTGELDVANATTTSNTVTLNCGTEGFELVNAASRGNSVFAVIQPGTHAITIRYTIKPEVSVNHVEGATFTIDKTIPSRPFSVNGVTTIKHALGVESYPTDLFYTWDAVNPYWYGVSSENIPNFMGASHDDYPTAADERNRWFNDPIVVENKYMAQNSCKNLPNINTISWYAMRGDPRWEKNYPWFYKGNGGAHIYTYGAWFLKWENIPEKPDGDKLNCPKDIDGIDRRLTSASERRYAYSTSQYRTGNRPSATEIDKYFFLPAMGHFEDGAIPKNAHGCYWTSSSPQLNTKSYVFTFTYQEVSITYNNNLQRKGGRIVAPADWFK